MIAGINDLATLEPLLVKQWSEKNKIKPTEVSIGSHKKVIWRCEKGHEWEAAVKSRTINKTGCPYCSHNKVLAGFNDLATFLTDIAAEWSDRNYPTLPTQVTVFANRKAYEAEQSNTGKKKKAGKGAKPEVTDNTRNKEDFEAMKRKTKGILIGMIAAVVAAVAGVVAYKATH